MDTTKSSFTSQSPELDSFHPTLQSAFEAGDPNVETKAAERDLVEVVRRIYDSLAKGDVDGILQHFEPDVVLDLYAPPEFQFIRHADGPVQAKELIVQNFQLVEQQIPRVTCVIAQGDTVMVALEETGIIRRTRSPYSIQAVQRFTFRDRKVSNFSQVIAHVG